jgi:hypothetical protein
MRRWRRSRGRKCSPAWVLVGVLTLLGTGCAPSIDLATGLEVELISTGWLDVGAAGGKNKVVPAVSIKLKNVSDQTLSVLQVNALFRRDGDERDLGDGFLTATGSDGLTSGSATGAFLIASHLGYTGTDSAAAMLQNSQFVDARVDLFAKFGSAQWTKLGAYPIARQLIAR